MFDFTNTHRRNDSVKNQILAELANFNGKDIRTFEKYRELGGKFSEAEILVNFGSYAGMIRESGFGSATRPNREQIFENMNNVFENIRVSCKRGLHLSDFSADEMADILIEFASWETAMKWFYAKRSEKSAMNEKPISRKEYISSIPVPPIKAELNREEIFAIILEKWTNLKASGKGQPTEMSFSPLVTKRIREIGNGNFHHGMMAFCEWARNQKISS